MEVEVGVQLEKASWRGGKMSYSGLNGVARNFPCQRTKFRVCQRYERKENSFLGPSPWRLQSVCQWKSVIQRSGYGKLSPKHNLHGLKSILSLLFYYKILTFPCLPPNLSNANDVDLLLCYEQIVSICSHGLPRWHNGKESACQSRRHRRCGFSL